MRTTMWVAGDDLPGRGGLEAVANPATEEVLAEVPSASSDQVDRAVEAARAALPGWRRTPAGDRGELLHGVAAWLREHTGELGRLMTLEGGKPLVENTDEVGWTANAFSYDAELGRHERGRVIPSVEEGQLSLVLKEPVGVVAAIVPWNYPLLLLAWKVAPALAAGNTVVVKPSPYTPLATLRLAEALAELPDGVVNLVTGGAEVGVCDDVDLDVAAPGAAWAAYLNAGQVCTSAERFYVLEPVYEEFVDRLVAVTEGLRMGDPLDPSTGGAGSWPRRSWWTWTTPWTCSPPRPSVRWRPCSGSAPWTRRSPGPTPSPTDRGPTSTRARWTTSCAAWRSWRREPSGSTIRQDGDAGPFGGMKMSGNARELGPEGLEAFRETKHVHLDGRANRKPGGIPTANRVSLVDRIKPTACPADGGGMSTLRSPEVGR